MTSYAEIKAKLEEEGKKIRKRSSYDEHNLQAAEVRYIRGVYPDLEGVFFAFTSNIFRLTLSIFARTPSHLSPFCNSTITCFCSGLLFIFLFLFSLI